MASARWGVPCLQRPTLGSTRWGQRRQWLGCDHSSQEQKKGSFFSGCCWLPLLGVGDPSGTRPGQERSCCWHRGFCLLGFVVLFHVHQAQELPSGVGIQRCPGASLWSCHVGGLLLVCPSCLPPGAVCPPPAPPSSQLSCEVSQAVLTAASQVGSCPESPNLSARLPDHQGSQGWGG